TVFGGSTTSSRLLDERQQARAIASNLEHHARRGQLIEQAVLMVGQWTQLVEPMIPTQRIGQHVAFSIHNTGKTLNLRVGTAQINGTCYGILTGQSRNLVGLIILRHGTLDRRQQ